jgi:hypothetical protein
MLSDTEPEVGFRKGVLVRAMLRSGIRSARCFPECDTQIALHVGRPAASGLMLAGKTHRQRIEVFLHFRISTGDNAPAFNVLNEYPWD